MPMRRIICTLLISFLVPATLCAETVFESSQTALENLRSNVRRVTLANGMRILLYRRGIAPVFAGTVSVKVGGVDEVPGETGISHMFEHMAFKGTEVIGTKDYEREKVLLARLESIIGDGRQLSAFSEGEKKEWAALHAELGTIWKQEQFSREFERRGASGLNASTDKEQTRYFVSMPRPSFEFWCMMESERLLNPVLRQFYQERDVVLEERRMRFDDDPMGKLYELFMLAAYRTHPYREPIIGYEKDIRSLTATKLEAFRKKYYVPSNIVVSIVGDVDPDKDLPVIEKYFGRLPAGERVQRTAVVEPRQGGEQTLSMKAKAAAAFMVGYHKVNFPNPDDARITIMSEVLNGSSDSPLLKALVKRGRFAASVSDEEAPGVAFPNMLLFSVATKAPYSNSVVLRKFDEVVEAFKRDGTTSEAVEVAKRSIAMEYLGQMKSNLGLSSTLGSTELEFGRWEVLIDWYLQAMKVTPKDVQQAAQKYLDRSQRVVGFLEYDGGAAQ